MTNDVGVPHRHSPHHTVPARLTSAAGGLLILLGVVLAGCSARSDASGPAHPAAGHSSSRPAAGSGAAARVVSVAGNPGRVTIAAGTQVTVRLDGVDMTENFVGPLHSSAAAVVRVVHQSSVYVGSTTMTATLRGVHSGTATLTAVTRPLCACKGHPSRLTVTVTVTG